MTRLAALPFLLAAGLHSQDGVIGGTVRDATAKTPLPGATVSLVGNGFEASGTSDGTGAFRFEHLAPDLYRVRCQLAGYEGSEVRGAFHLVDLRSQHVREGLSIDLTATSTIEGTVFDEDGKPIPGVSLFALGRLLGTTDRDGHFQMKDLAPENYRVDLRIPAEARRRTLKHDAETGETFGYPNTVYYPGTDDPQAAVRVPVAAGLHLRGLDIRLRRVRLVDLSGRVVERTGGEPLAGAHVGLSPNFSTLADETLGVQAVNGAGAFRFDLIPPGSYALLVYRGDSKLALPWVENVEVGKTGAGDYVVRVPPFQKLEGTVAMAQEGAEWTGRLTVSLVAMQRAVPSRNFNVIAPDFSMDDLPPGRYSLRVQSNAELKGSSRRLAVSSVHFGTQDLAANVLSIAESGNPPLEIRLTAETGRMVVRIPAAEDTTPVRLVYVNTGRTGESGMSTMAYPAGADGIVSLDSLAPDVYEVAFADGSLNPTRVEVKAGETALVELRPPRH